MSIKQMFLSRLCSGERRVIRTVNCSDFLSRLCSGEHIRTNAEPFFIFLSRLCSGEPPLADPLKKAHVSKPPVQR